ncbi:hypothetical protein B0H63DRAFT_518515 [Podospora didyma]|uniref:Uncharacterized protein n=1 Tax=Podospora didyma TaxID=330526 RepID=A0AAE0NWZ7_9PEZI|nr:hypothetical protein B0H63DRAFT_518515 [Podospora didyma]
MSFRYLRIPPEARLNTQAVMYSGVTHTLQQCIRDLINTSRVVKKELVTADGKSIKDHEHPLIPGLYDIVLKGRYDLIQKILDFFFNRNTEMYQYIHGGFEPFKLILEKNGAEHHPSRRWPTSSPRARSNFVRESWLSTKFFAANSIQKHLPDGSELTKELLDKLINQHESSPFGPHLASTCTNYRVAGIMALVWLRIPKWASGVQSS